MQGFGSGGLDVSEAPAMYKAQDQALHFSFLVLTITLLASIGVGFILQMQKLGLRLGAGVDLPTFKPGCHPLECRSF